MRVEAEDLSRVLFELFIAHGCNARDPELLDKIAAIEIVGAEGEVVAALVELSSMIEMATARH